MKTKSQLSLTKTCKKNSCMYTIQQRKSGEKQNKYIKKIKDTNIKLRHQNKEYK